MSWEQLSYYLAQIHGNVFYINPKFFIRQTCRKGDIFMYKVSVMYPNRKSLFWIPGWLRHGNRAGRTHIAEGYFQFYRHHTGSANQRDTWL